MMIVKKTYEFSPENDLIGKGGFGCVIAPALKCSKKDKDIDKMVSKVIPSHDMNYSNELKISQVLK